MIIPITIDLTDLTFSPKHSIETLAGEKSMLFFEQIRKQLKAQIAEKAKVEGILKAFLLSPAGFVFDTYGMGELIKNALSAGATKIEVGILFKGPDAKGVRDDIVCIVKDNGKGFTESFLNKDPHKKIQTFGFADYRRIIDPTLENLDQFAQRFDDQAGKAVADDKIARIKSTKIIEKKEETAALGHTTVIGGKGEGVAGLTKLLALLGGYLEVGNVDDLRLYFYSQILETVWPDLKDQKSGAVTVIHSPVFSEDLLKKEALFSKRYKAYLIAHGALKIPEEVEHYDMGEVGPTSPVILEVSDDSEDEEEKNSEGEEDDQVAEMSQDFVKRGSPSVSNHSRSSSSSSEPFTPDPMSPSVNSPTSADPLSPTSPLSAVSPRYRVFTKENKPEIVQMTAAQKKKLTVQPPPLKPPKKP